MEYQFIKDLSNRQIGSALERFAILGDMDPPDQASEVVEMLRNKFWKYPSEILKDGFDQWLIGNYPDIFRVKKMTIKFLCDILNEYTRNNHHRLRIYQPPILPPPPEDPKIIQERSERSIEICIDQFNRAYHQKSHSQVSRWLMQISWDYLVKEGRIDEDRYQMAQISPLIDFLEENNIRERNAIVMGLEANKRKYYDKLFQDLDLRSMDQRKAIQSAKMACYILEFHNPKNNHENI